MQRADRQPHPRRDRSPGRAGIAQRGYFHDVHIRARPSKPFALGAGRGQSRAYPLTDQFALELSDGGEDPEAAKLRKEELSSQGRKAVMVRWARAKKG